MKKVRHQIVGRVDVVVCMSRFQRERQEFESPTRLQAVVV